MKGDAFLTDPKARDNASRILLLFICSAHHIHYTLERTAAATTTIATTTSIET